MKCVVDENLYQIVLRSVSNGAFGIPEQHHVRFKGSKEEENAENAEKICICKAG